jgi:quercetin dioxygenase-like cupin family protein
MKRIIIALAAVAVVTAGVAVATPSRGFSAEVLGTKTVKRLSIEEPDPSTTMFIRIEQEVGGTSGWHSHPAHVFVLVKHGRVVRVNHECERTVFEKGEIFVERPGHVHKAINVGDNQLVLLATFVGLPPETPPTTDEPNPCLS